MILLGAYYYPGWHTCPVRNASMPRGWSEWHLLKTAVPHFSGHRQPLQPLWGYEDDSLPEVFAQKVHTALSYHITFFMFAFYWSRGKQLLYRALREGFLPIAERFPQFRFALMWANRMPRFVLPVKNPAAQVIDPHRLVYTDPDDFLAFIQHIATEYFIHPQYLRLQDGSLYLSIFDTTFFLRQMGLELARDAIAKAKAWLEREGFGRLHLAAIDPIPDFRPYLQEVGFDSVTHYVLLPEWKGEWLQDYAMLIAQRTCEWQSEWLATLPRGLCYCPSVSPGWDATPRSVQFGKEKPRKYPWWPIVTGNSPELFFTFVDAALKFAYTNTSPYVMLASWNEWTEGHYLEPDSEYGYRWLEAVMQAVLAQNYKTLSF